MMAFFLAFTALYTGRPCGTMRSLALATTPADPKATLADGGMYVVT